VAPREVRLVPREQGGTCQRDCFNVHVKKVELSARWETYEVNWSDVVQRGYGMPPFDPSRLNSLQFLVRPEDTPYDLWFDDIRFLQH
jgi:hypothetical protein